MTAQRKGRPKQRTYWHLGDQRRRPTDYDIATSRLLYYPERGFEVRTPADAWYERYQRGSPLRARDWDRFRDPREATYSRYVAQQQRKEAFVDGLLASIDDTGYDARLSPAWVRTLDRVLPTLRFPLHGLQMVASYVGHMAPGGRIVVACLLQTGDEIRMIQRVAYRMRQLAVTHAGFGDRSADAWQRDPRWQPLRECVERLLVTYDWGEAFTALNLAVKPVIDELTTVWLGRRAERRGDELLGAMLSSLAEDRRWHRAWSAALVRVALEDFPDNRGVFEEWIDRWRPRAVAAIEPVVELLNGDSDGDSDSDSSRGAGDRGGVHGDDVAQILNGAAAVLALAGLSPTGHERGPS